jgi:flagellar motor switch protein FliN/FliY
MAALADMSAVQTPRARTAPGPEGHNDVPTLDKVSLDISVVLGTSVMPIHQVLRLGRGAIVELDAAEEDDVKILANNHPVAEGTVVVNGNRIAVEVKRLLPKSPDLR